MFEKVGAWIVGILIDKLGAYLSSLLKKKEEYKDIDKKAESIARSVNVVTEEIYQLEEEFRYESSSEVRRELLDKILELENELRLITKYQSGS